MHWNTLSAMEQKRKGGAYGGDGYVMLKKFFEEIGSHSFIQEFHKTTATVEVAKFYDLEINTKEDMETLFTSIGKNKCH